MESFTRGQQVYGPGDEECHIYRLLDGRVKVARLAGSRVTIVVDVYLPGEIFGESALLGAQREGEQAVAMEPSRVIKWNAAALGELVTERPPLAVALMHFAAERCVGLKERLESLSGEDTSRRLGRALFEFATRAGGSPAGDVSIQPLTHEVLAQYVGTSREIVSQHMSRLRNQGYIGYSRRGILVHRDRLREWLFGLVQARHA